MSTRQDFNRLIALGDTHCGSISGLTPPRYELVPEVDSHKFELYELRQWSRPMSRGK